MSTSELDLPWIHHTMADPRLTLAGHLFQSGTTQYSLSNDKTDPQAQKYIDDALKALNEWKSEMSSRKRSNNGTQRARQPQELPGNNNGPHRQHHFAPIDYGAQTAAYFPALYRECREDRHVLSHSCQLPCLRIRYPAAVR